MSDIKFDCASCGESLVIDDSQFEPSSETDSTIYGQEIDCPHCGKKTRVRKWKPLFNKLQDSPKADSEIPRGYAASSVDRHSIRETAQILAVLGKWLIGAAVLAILLTCCVATTSNASDEVPQDWFIGCAISGSLFTLGIWLYLIAQVVHIAEMKWRALTQNVTAIPNWKHQEIFGC